ncbi:hypothetical protein P261_01758 [Lachnospiraceae bacterium TWA4]|nr:hypothetical protein P261_01758 [Lachnospiraceae bacterium TWA4]
MSFTFKLIIVGFFFSTIIVKLTVFVFFLFSFNFAVIVALPSANAVTTPSDVTFAIFLSELLHAAFFALGTFNLTVSLIPKLILTFFAVLLGVANEFIGTIPSVIVHTSINTINKLILFLNFCINDPLSYL